MAYIMCFLEDLQMLYMMILIVPFL